MREMLDPDRPPGKPYDPESDVSPVARAAVEMHAEWRLVNRALRDGDLDDCRGEALAYQEGLLRCMRLLSRHTGVHVRPTDEAGASGGGATDARSDAAGGPDDETPDAGRCRECGGEKRHEMGSADGFCPRCDL